MWGRRCFSLSLRAKRQVTLISPRLGLGRSHRRRLILDIRLGPRAWLLALQSLHKVAPADHGLAGVQPDTGRHPHQHGAQILHHVDLEDGTCLRCTWRPGSRAGYGEGFTDVAMPLNHPLVEVVILVEQTPQQTQCGQYKEAREETNTQHEALQFVRSLAIRLHHGANAEQRDEACEQEECADRQIYAEWQY